MEDKFEELFMAIEKTLFIYQTNRINITYEDDKFDVFDLQEVCELIQRKYPEDIIDFHITLNNLQKRYEIVFNMGLPF